MVRMVIILFEEMCNVRAETQSPNNLSEACAYPRRQCIIVRNLKDPLLQQLLKLPDFSQVCEQPAFVARMTNGFLIICMSLLCNEVVGSLLEPTSI
jgi:hypothetical protein